MIISLSIYYIKLLRTNVKTGNIPTVSMGWEEVPPGKGELGCFGKKRYLMTLGRTFYNAVYSEGWDVGRDEEKRCC
jgi:hypothetical protein